jgi:hypothetical protein
VRDVGGSEKLVVGGDRTANVIACDQVTDIAVLRVDGTDLGPAINLSPRIRTGGGFLTTGLSKFGTGFEKAELTGTFLRQFELVSLGTRGTRHAWQLFAEGEGKFVPGLSGSPVFSETRDCVAIVRQKIDPGQKGIAVPVDAIRDICPDLARFVLTDDDRHEGSSPEGQKLRMNLEREIGSFIRIASGKDQETRIVLIQAAQGMGKTLLLEDYKQIAQNYDMDICEFELSQISIDTLLSGTASKFGDSSRLPKFFDFKNRIREPQNWSEYYRLMASNLFQDISNLNEDMRVALLLDNFQHCDPEFKKWFPEHFATQIAVSYGSPFKPPRLLVVVAGREKPRVPSGLNTVKEFDLEVPSLESWMDCLEAYGIVRDRKLLEDMYRAYKGLPLHLSVATDVFIREDRHKGAS